MPLITGGSKGTRSETSTYAGALQVLSPNDLDTLFSQALRLLGEKGEIIVGDKFVERVFPTIRDKADRLRRQEAVELLKEGLYRGHEGCAMTLFDAYAYGKGCIEPDATALDKFCEEVTTSEKGSCVVRAAVAAVYGMHLAGLVVKPSSVIEKDPIKAEKYLERSLQLEGEDDIAVELLEDVKETLNNLRLSANNKQQGQAPENDVVAPHLDGDDGCRFSL